MIGCEPGYILFRVLGDILLDDPRELNVRSGGVDLNRPGLHGIDDLI
jgi:hypothetical protein